jgi:LPXTG-site transpeptidase (sortase) family protein
MPRYRRTSWIRRFFGFVMFGGFVVFVVAGTVVTRNYLNGDGVVLVVDDARGETPNTIPADAASVDRRSPLSIHIGDLELDNPVRAVGVEEDGQLEVPDETEVGWYQYGSAPGLPGATVLAAHVSWNRKIGPFHQLGNLEPGAQVDVVADDGSTRVYEVVERTIYDKDELPRDRIWTTTGDETLVLITCGGSYNPEIRRYRQNIVVYAVPVDEVPGPTGDLT